MLGPITSQMILRLVMLIVILVSVVPWLNNHKAAYVL